MKIILQIICVSFALFFSSHSVFANDDRVLLEASEALGDIIKMQCENHDDKESCIQDSLCMWKDKDLEQTCSADPYQVKMQKIYLAVALIGPILISYASFYGIAVAYGYFFPDEAVQNPVHNNNLNNNHQQNLQNLNNAAAAA